MLTSENIFRMCTFFPSQKLNIFTMRAIFWLGCMCLHVECMYLHSKCKCLQRTSWNREKITLLGTKLLRYFDTTHYRMFLRVECWRYVHTFKMYERTFKMYVHTFKIKCKSCCSYILNVCAYIWRCLLKMLLKNVSTYIQKLGPFFG